MVDPSLFKCTKTYQAVRVFHDPDFTLFKNDISKVALEGAALTPVGAVNSVPKPLSAFSTSSDGPSCGK